MKRSLAGIVAVATLSAGCQGWRAGADSQRNQASVVITPADTIPDSLGTLTGVATAMNGRKAVAGAMVALTGTPHRVFTDSLGRYTIQNVPPGSYVMAVRRIGYGQLQLPGVTIAAGSLSRQDVTLGAAAIEVERTFALRGFAAGLVTSAGLEQADELVVLEAPAHYEVVTTAPSVGNARARAFSGRGMARDARASERAEKAPPIPTQGALHVRNAKGETVGEFPLRHTEVAAEISGYLARTVVEQRYTNPYKEAIEAVYTFPLPALGAVSDFVMEIGTRKIVGIVRPREEAERIYQQARARGQTASLLTQERPNIFTQNVANIEAGGSVTIRMTYIERLNYEHGEYQYVFPMVVGPRYIAGQPQNLLARRIDDREQGSQRPTGTGTAPPTDRVPDADRITPPVLAPGQRSGHDIGLNVRLDAGLPITHIVVPTHQVEVSLASQSERVVKLARSDSIPNRDFVLKWRVAGAQTQFGVLAHRGKAGGFFTMTMQPPLEPRDDQVTPREITFILDVSGSMSGLPIEISKELVRWSLDELREDDRFNIFFFAGWNGQLWLDARPRTRENVAEAKRFLGTLEGDGGTEMMAGLRRAMSARHDPRHLQMYVFLTDGYVGEDQEILRVVKEERGDARFFAFGIGSSVNRFLIDGVGEHGGGMSHIVIPRDSAYASTAVSRLFDVIDSPVLVDIKMDWNGLPVNDVYPSRVRDLFAGQTIALVGRYTKSARGTAYVTGRIGERTVRYPVRIDLPDAEERNAALAPAWARHRIHDLSGEMLTAAEARKGELRKTITDLAVEFRLMSQFTSFVAVDESRIVGDGRPLRVVQPVELPEGVSYEGIFGERPIGVPVRIGAWGMTIQGTESGRVRVGAVTPGGAAARAGIEAGGVLESIDDTSVNDIAHLETLLLQSRGSTVRVGMKSRGGIELAAP